MTQQQTVLPIFPAPGSLVRVPAKGGGYIKTWTMTEARDLGRGLRIKCVGEGEVEAGRVKEV